MAKTTINPLDLLNKMRTMDYGKVLKRLTGLKESDPKSYRALEIIVIKSQRKLPSLGKCHDCKMRFGDRSAMYPWTIEREVVSLCCDCNRKRLGF